MIDLLVGYLITMSIMLVMATIFTLFSLAQWKSTGSSADAKEVRMFAKLFPIALVWPLALVYYAYRLAIWTYKTTKEFINE